MHWTKFKHIKMRSGLRGRFGQIKLRKCVAENIENFKWSYFWFENVNRKINKRRFGQNYNMVQIGRREMPSVSLQKAKNHQSLVQGPML